MSSIKTYLQKARETIEASYEEVNDIRLEEFEIDSREIVVSFLLPERNPEANLMALTMGTRKYERVYKRVTFDSATQIISVKIHTPQ